MFFRNMWCRILLFVAVVSCNKVEEYDLLEGEPTTIEKYPFAAQIIRYQFGGTYTIVCAGTLVTKRYVLTAGRCFVSSWYCRYRKTTTTTATTNITTTAPPKKLLRKRSGLYIDPAGYRVRVGSTSAEGSGGIRYEVSAIILHENRSIYDNDIALVRTRNPIHLGRTIAIINIPQQEVMMPDNATGTVIGWGSMMPEFEGNKVLHEVFIKKVNWQRCKNIHANHRKDAITVFTDNMICGDGDIGYNLFSFPEYSGSEQLNQRGSFVSFKVKCAMGAEVLLQNKDGDSVQIIYGSSKNTKVRVNHNGALHNTYNVPNLLNGSEYRGFWIRWNRANISTGRESEAVPFVTTTLPKLDFSIVKLTFNSDSLAFWKIKGMDKTYCMVDAGSPLLYGDNLVGLATWFEHCGNDDIPNVFTRVSKYTSWIDNVIKRSTYRADPHPSASSMNKIGVTLLIPILYSVLGA